MATFPRQKKTARQSDCGKADGQEDGNEEGGGNEEEERADEDAGEYEVKENVREAFSLVATGDDTVNGYSLKTLLENLTEEYGSALEFSLDMCRSMVALMNLSLSSYSGTLTLEEFDRLHKLLIRLEKAFRDHDIDYSGQLSTYELRKALRNAVYALNGLKDRVITYEHLLPMLDVMGGYSVNQHVLKALILHYGHDRQISLSDFIACAVKLMCMIDIYNAWDPDNENAVVLSRKEWLKHTVYC